MSFTRGFEVLLHKSNNYITKITLDGGITVYNYNDDSKLISKKELRIGKYTFLDICFDINEEDSLYGIINDKEGALIYVYAKNNIISKSNFIKYNSDIFRIKLPYIKRIKDNISIIYYLLDKENPYVATLINHYRIDGKWVKYEIDVINYQILTDFITLVDEEKISVFYFKIIGGYTELFMCNFSFEIGVWDQPIQVTSSGKCKVYLSVIMGFDNKYHITYAENNIAHYNCKYINGYLQEEKFIIYNDLTICETIACTFPSIAEYNNSVYIQWSEYQNLYTSISESYGETWTKPNIVRGALNYNFLRCNYKHNCDYNKNVNLSTMFLKENSLDIFKFIKNPR